jgi:hypothetical protein
LRKASVRPGVAINSANTGPLSTNDPRPKAALIPC